MCFSWLNGVLIFNFYLLYPMFEQTTICLPFFWGGDLYFKLHVRWPFCFQVEKYRLRLTSAVPTTDSFFNAIVASVSNFTNNKRDLNPCCIACRISICLVYEHQKKMKIKDKCNALLNFKDKRYFFFPDIYQGQRIHCYTIPDRGQRCWVYSSYGWLWMSHNYLPESPTQYQISTCHSEYTLLINYHWLLHLLSVPSSSHNCSFIFQCTICYKSIRFHFTKLTCFQKL